MQRTVPSCSRLVGVPPFRSSAYSAHLASKGCTNVTRRSSVCTLASSDAGLSQDTAAAARDSEYNFRMAQQMGWDNAGKASLKIAQGVLSPSYGPHDDLSLL